MDIGTWGIAVEESRYLGSCEMEIIFSVGPASGGAGEGDSFMRTVDVNLQINSVRVNYHVILGISLCGGTGCM